MSQSKPLTQKQAASFAVYFQFPDRHCNKITDGLKWNAEQMDVFHIANPIIRSGGMVIIHGTRGIGKTQMAAGLGYEWWNQGYYKSRGKARYWILSGLFSAQKRSFGNEYPSEQPLNWARDCGLLVLDEIDTDQNSNYDKRELRDLIDARYRDDGKPTVFLTNLKPDRLRDALDYSILDRVRENGAIVQLLGTSYRASSTCRS